jgi:hypothetical protein
MYTVKPKIKRTSNEQGTHFFQGDFAALGATGAPLPLGARTVHRERR